MYDDVILASPKDMSTAAMEVLIKDFAKRFAYMCSMASTLEQDEGGGPWFIAHDAQETINHHTSA